MFSLFGFCVFLTGVLLLYPEARNVWKGSVVESHVASCVLVLWECGRTHQCQSWQTTFANDNATTLCIIDSQKHYTKDTIMPIVVFHSPQECSVHVSSFQLSQLCWSIIFMCYLVNLILFCYQIL